MREKKKHLPQGLCKGLQGGARKKKFRRHQRRIVYKEGRAFVAIPIREPNPKATLQASKSASTSSANHN